MPSDIGFESWDAMFGELGSQLPDDRLTGQVLMHTFIALTAQPSTDILCRQAHAFAGKFKGTFDRRRHGARRRPSAYLIGSVLAGLSLSAHIVRPTRDEFV